MSLEAVVSIYTKTDKGFCRQAADPERTTERKTERTTAAGGRCHWKP